MATDSKFHGHSSLATTIRPQQTAAHTALPAIVGEQHSDECLRLLAPASKLSVKRVNPRKENRVSEVILLISLLAPNLDRVTLEVSFFSRSVNVLIFS